MSRKILAITILTFCVVGGIEGHYFYKYTHYTPIQTKSVRVSSFSRAEVEAYQLQLRKQLIEERIKAKKVHFEDEQIHCLALNIMHEAAFQPWKGMLAVAVVTMNRVHTPGYPSTVCGVVYQRAFVPKYGKIVCAFSWTCQPRHYIAWNQWEEAMKIAKDVYFKHWTLPGFRNVLNYYSDAINAPNWANREQFVAKIGNQLFYRPVQISENMEN